MATNLEIQRQLLEEAVAIGGHRSKRAAVEAALTEYVNRHRQQSILKQFGEIEFDPDHDYKKARKQPCGDGIRKTHRRLRCCQT